MTSGRIRSWSNVTLAEPVTGTVATSPSIAGVAVLDGRDVERDRVEQRLGVDARDQLRAAARAWEPELVADPVLLARAGERAEPVDVLRGELGQRDLHDGPGTVRRRRGRRAGGDQERKGEEDGFAC